MLAGMVLTTGLWGWRTIEQKGGSKADPSSRVQSGINPNTAAWYELAQLPGLGESAGRAIVAYREERTRTTTRPVFTNAADLEPVPGIGPRTIERIANHLRFDHPE